MDEEATREPVRCPSCGRVLPADVAEALCPVCLLQAAFVTISDDPAQSGDLARSRGNAGDALTVREGVRWGDYRIGRLLGRGGMGDVYEASHVATGRRLALKVLRRVVLGPEDRARFLREGQLAASISHPRTVFVFGAEEIDGVPVILMELVPGGTLKDRVSASGPLTPSDAAAATLDIISGLEAAHVAGILHRDVKPSNCFVDHEGGVKIGDFGISISTASREVSSELATGFQGTPQFAAPEQLRGEPLDVRSDIYAVGATLYYLLTGQPPFTARQLPELIERVERDLVPSPRSLRPGIPRGLATLTLRCLSKAPSARPESYAEIAEALRPFVGGHHAAARPGSRLLAGLVDYLLVAFPLGLVEILRAFAGSADTSPTDVAIRWSWAVLGMYYVLLEGTTGASVGKRLFGLQVVSATGPISFSRALLRTSIFIAPGFVLFVIRLWHGPISLFTVGGPDPLNRPLSVVMTAILFLTARRRNGWAGLHDLVSATGVVSMAVPARRRLAPSGAQASVGPVTSDRRIGPFEIVRELGATDRGILTQGFDPALRRAVWIHRFPAGTAESSPARRDVSRITRLRWLMGPRDDSAWDAFEAPRGRPLLAVDEPIEWPMLRGWLIDLGEELARTERDGALPALTLAHVWVREDGHLTLLDFPYPSVIAAGHPDVSSSKPIALIPAIVAYVRGRAPRGTMYPLSLVKRVDEWAHAPSIDMQALCAETIALAKTADRVTSARRGLPIALAGAPIAAMLVAGLAGMTAMRTMRTFEHANMLWWLDALSAEPGSHPLAPQSRGAAEQYVTERFRASLGDETFWTGVRPRPERQRARHRLARRLLEQYQADPDSLPSLARQLGPEIARADADSRILADSTGPFVALIVSTVSALMLVLVMSAHLVSSAVVRGGLVSRAAGLAVVTPEGHEISRLRSFTRAVVAWSPALVWFLYLAASPKTAEGFPLAHFPILAMALTHAVLLVGAIVTVSRPSRGLSDMLVNVWVVPR
jgi:eukaryotic-like serine/threonine-protein kinase